MGKRDSKILEILTARKRVEVSELARELGVSSVTIRKDLDELEAREVIGREHGFAVLGNRNDINGRLAYHYETKRLLATRASELVADGETVMIESGSCCALLAQALAGSKRIATLVTNSAFIASYVRHEPGAHTVLLAGDFQNDSQVMVGPLVAQSAQNFCVDKLFIGVDGYTPELGFTNSDHLRAQAVRDMACQVHQVVVLTESEKFTHRGVVPLRLGTKVHTVVTDDAISEQALGSLLAQGIQVITVPAHDQN